MIRVETNPRQILLRLKNKIVFLSRPQFGFNPDAPKNDAYDDSWVVGGYACANDHWYVCEQIWTCLSVKPSCASNMSWRSIS